MRTPQTATREADIFMFDPEAETMPREALTALQTTRLKQTLQRAYADVPHYQRSGGCGVNRKASVASRHRALSVHDQN